MSAGADTAPSDLDRLIATRIRDVEDFPEAGVTFKDITPLLADHTAFTTAVQALADAGRDTEGRVQVDKVVGMEARGFILAAPVALALGVGFVPVRKPGKLPWHTRSRDYQLEYGSATLEMHTDAVDAGERVLIVDDVLATGGTAAATASLIEEIGGSVHGIAVLMELTFLPGRAAVSDYRLTALHTV